MVVVGGAAGGPVGNRDADVGLCWEAVIFGEAVPHAASKAPASNQIRCRLRMSRQGQFCATAPRCQTFW